METSDGSTSFDAYSSGEPFWIPLIQIGQEKHRSRPKSIVNFGLCGPKALSWIDRIAKQYI